VKYQPRLDSTIMELGGMGCRVLMIGPGRGIVGGISSLVETVVPALDKRVKLVYLPSVKNRDMKRSGKISLFNIANAFRQYAIFLAAILKHRPQIVHLHTSQGTGFYKDLFHMIMAKLCRCRLVVHVHAAEPEALCGHGGSICRKIAIMSFSISDTVIAVSEKWREFLSQLIDSRKVVTLVNCVNCRIFDFPEKNRLALTLNVLFLGEVGPRKGVFDLLKAMDNPKLRGSKIKLWVAGAEERDGDFKRAQKLSEKLRIGAVCKIFGTVIGQYKIDLLRHADVFVLPSYNEGLPIAILEAMASSLPIISTTVGGIPEIVRDGFNGYLIKPGDIEALADRLSHFLTNHKIAQEMGRNSRSIAEAELDVEGYVDRLLTIYESHYDSNIDDGVRCNLAG
jgi:glycosyltransferase involved in cell wall biosynthesis